MRTKDKKQPIQETPVAVCATGGNFADTLTSELARLGVASDLLPAKPAASAAYHVLVVDADEIDVGAVVTAARARNPRITVLVVGTNPSKDLLFSLIRTGVFDFVEQPVDTRSLALVIRSLYERSVLSQFSAEVSRRLRTSESLLDRSQSELHREVIRSNEELQAVNKRLHKVVSQLKTLYHMGRDLAENENWSDALDRFLMALVNFMEADGASLLLFSHHETVLQPRSNFQVDAGALDRACTGIIDGWNHHPRASEIHPLESYEPGKHSSCLERTEPWRITIIPLRHRNQPLGFLILEKQYTDGFDFKWDYDFLNTLQTIFVEEIANASYISELRRLGRFNNKVLDNIRSGVITTDLDGVVSYYNAWACDLCPRLHDIKKGAPLHFDSLFSGNHFAGSYFDEIMRSDDDSHVLEVECHGEEKRYFHARLRTTKMYDDNLDGMVIVGIFEDLTEQKRMEDEIRRNDRLRVLGQLSAGVAHEIRNPLTGIATSAEVLAGKLAGDTDKTKFVRAMLDEINRLDSIIRSLLNFARPPKPTMADCSLPEVVGRVMSLLEDQAAGKGVTLAIERTVEELHCRADSAQLTQVFLNLVLNAIQACDEGDQVKIELKSDEGRKTGTARVVRIDVIDSGPGVPDDVRANLFEPFVTTKSQGTGLGLAITQQIVEDHRGTIQCDFLERGTRFSIELPELIRRANDGTADAEERR